MAQQKYARVDENIVVEILTLPNNMKITDAIHPDLVSQWFSCSAKVERGWNYDGKVFAAPQILEPSSIDLTAYAAHKRWQVETGGITLNGVEIATDDRSKIMITGTRVKAVADPAYHEAWKTAAGSFVTLDAPSLIAISDAVLDHVSACFATERLVIADIEAGKITSTDAIDAYEWPGR